MRLKVEIKPSQLDRETISLNPDTYLDDFIVKVWPEGKEMVELRLQLKEDELLSCFDQIWDMAKQQVLEAITKE